MVDVDVDRHRRRASKGGGRRTVSSWGGTGSGTVGWSGCEGEGTDGGGEESGDKTSVRSLEDTEDEDRGLKPSCPMNERWSSCERSVIFAGEPGHSSSAAIVALWSQWCRQLRRNAARFSPGLDAYVTLLKY